MLIIVTGCTESSPLISDDDLVVVWGFVYANEPITDIKLTRTLPLDADSSSKFSTINDADVSVIVNQDRFKCDLAPGDSGYYQYLANDLTINTGDIISIEIEWQGQSIRGESIVPLPPRGLALESNIMEIISAIGKVCWIGALKNERLLLNGKKNLKMIGFMWF